MVTIVFIFILSNFLRSFRYLIICNQLKLKSVTFFTALRLTFSSYFLNALLPGRLGESVKFMEIQEEKSKILVSIIAEKISEFILLIWNFFFLIVWFQLINLSLSIFLIFSLLGWSLLFLINNYTREFQQNVLKFKFSNKELSVFMISSFPSQLLDALCLKLILDEFLTDITLLRALLAISGGVLNFALPIVPGAFGQFELTISLLINQLTETSDALLIGIYAATIYRILSTLSHASIGIIPTIQIFFKRQKKK
jgi:uncharacterized membrane protein YbhN (UPF0104 family)